MPPTAMTMTRAATWLHLLRPADGSALSRAATNPLLIDEVVVRAGPGAAGWAVEHGQRLRADLAQEPFLRTSRGPCADAGFMEAVSLWAVLRLSGIEAVPSRLADELARVIRHGIPEGVLVERGLRCVRAAHAQLTRALFQFCETTLPPGEQLPTMRTISAELFDGMETLAALVAEEFAAERDRWFAGSAGERAELVNAILNGEPIDPRLALRQLGYDLTLHHVALVVWRAEVSSTSSRDLESTAVCLLETAGCSSFLLMPVGSGRLWAWGGRASGRPAELRRLDAPPEFPAGVLVASGLPGDGIDGFRRSHTHALTAERLGRLQPKRGRLYDYGALELTVLLGADSQAAAEFVTRELGPLAADERSMAALRDTVRCFLDQDGSLSATAGLLHIARNTVVYRVKKAEQLLGRSVREDRLRLHTALYLADHLGPGGQL